MREAFIQARVRPDLKEQLEAIAEAEGRTLSNLMERALTEWLASRKQRKVAHG